MHDDHTHDHADETPGATSRLTLVLVLVTGYMLVEAVGGWLTNSLALLADAGHMLTDAGAIGLALLAARLARKPSNLRNTYGYHRAEILAALANAVTLLVIAAGIVWEAYHRFIQPPPVMGREMMAIAVFGLLVNLFSVKLLHSDGPTHEHSLNVQGVFWHIVGDTLGSVAAITAALLIWWKGWYWADPVTSILICAIILFGAVKLIRASVHVLMEGSPDRLHVEEVQAALEKLPGVHDVHDLHVWTVTSNRESVSVHIVADDYARSTELLCAVRALLLERFSLEHVTVQVEPPNFERVECIF